MLLSFLLKKILQLLEYTYMTNDLFLLNVVFLWLLSPGVWGVGNNLFKILLEKRLKETFADDVEMLWLLKFSMFSSFSDSKLSVTVTSNLASWRLRVFMEEYLACLLGRFWLVSDLDLACIEPTLVAISTCKKEKKIFINLNFKHRLIFFWFRIFEFFFEVFFYCCIPHFFQIRTIF